MKKAYKQSQGKFSTNANRWEKTSLENQQQKL